MEAIRYYSFKFNIGCWNIHCWGKSSDHENHNYFYQRTQTTVILTVHLGCNNYSMKRLVSNALTLRKLVKTSILFGVFQSLASYIYFFFEFFISFVGNFILFHLCFYKLFVWILLSYGLIIKKCLKKTLVRR